MTEETSLEVIKDGKMEASVADSISVVGVQVDRLRSNEDIDVEPLEICSPLVNPNALAKYATDIGAFVRGISGEEKERLIALGQTKEAKLLYDINFDWYAVEKHPNFQMFKVVGLHKRQRGLNCIYLLGKDTHTGEPYILRCPPEYMKKPILECIRWNIGAGKMDKVYEV